MSPLSIPASALRVPVQPLTSAAFAPFGTVIENPLRSNTSKTYRPYPANGPLPPNIVRANQGSALKLLDVTHMTNFYPTSTEQKSPSKAVMNMFVCSPRPLREERTGTVTAGIPISATKSVEPYEGQTDHKEKFLFDVKILERHPYTSQTFVPLGLDAEDPATCYLVIVAPTADGILQYAESNSTSELQSSWCRPIDNFLNRARASLSSFDALPLPSSNSDNSTQRKGSGPPDLPNIRAFLANGSQAVTYGAGTWHAPMVVLGARAVDFVVVQFANGVALDDCQEVELQTDVSGKGVSVVIETAQAMPKAKL